MTATASEKPKTDTLHGPNLILDVENFGPIAEAKNIEFKPMTVFVGPSNTGKTYLAVLLHAILRANPERYGGFEWSFGDRDRVLIEPFQNEITPFWADVLRFLALARQAQINPTNIPIKDLSPDSRQIITQSANNYGLHYSNQAMLSIKEFFEVSHISELVTHGSSELSLFFDLHRGPEDGRISFPIHENSFVLDQIRVHVSEQLVTAFDLLEQTNSLDDLGKHLRNTFGSTVVDTYGNFPSSFYFPAGRAGIINAHRLLATAVIENSARFGIERASQLTYHRLARDFLQQLIGIRSNSIRDEIALRSWIASQADSENTCVRLKSLNRH